MFYASTMVEKKYWLLGPGIEPGSSACEALVLTDIRSKLCDDVIGKKSHIERQAGHRLTNEHTGLRITSGRVTSSPSCRFLALSSMADFISLPASAISLVPSADLSSVLSCERNSCDSRHYCYFLFVGVRMISLWRRLGEPL